MARLALLFLIASCAGAPQASTEAIDASPDVPGLVAWPTIPTPPSSRTYYVDVHATDFAPGVLYASVGDTVVWTWVTAHPRSLTSGLPGMPDGIFASGSHVEPYHFYVKFSGPGPYPYSDDACRCVGIVIVR